MNPPTTSPLLLLLTFCLCLFACNASFSKPSMQDFWYKSSEERPADGDQRKLCQFIGQIYTKEAVKTVIQLVSRRLDLARPVALYKWQNNQSIDDPVREAALLASVAAQANASGLTVPFAQQFFRDQINASKIIQFAYFAIWEARGAPNEMAPDLTTVTRPLINNVTSALVQALVPVQQIRRSKNCVKTAEQGLEKLMRAREMNSSSEADRPRAICQALAHLCA